MYVGTCTCIEHVSQGQSFVQGDGGPSHIEHGDETNYLTAAALFVSRRLVGVCVAITYSVGN